MAYKVIILYQLYMPSYFLGTFTEYPYYNGIGNRTSWCPVRIQGKPETKVFAWATGIGNSTGAGFGSIY